MENFISKMELISIAIIQLKKFRVDDSKGILELEEAKDNYITKDNFRAAMQQ